MATQPYVSGPTEVHAGVGAAGALAFLGFTENGVRTTEEYAFEDLISDLSGTRIPYDVQQMGGQAFIRADVNVYNEGILRQLKNRANVAPQIWNSATQQSNPPTSEGNIGVGQVGFLMRTESVLGASGAFRLLVYSPYNAKPAFQNPAGIGNQMDPCYNYQNAWLDGAVDLDLSSRYKKVACIFRAIPGWTVATGTGSLYDHNSTGRVAPT